MSAKNSFGVRSGAGVGPGTPGRERYLLLHSAAIPEKRPLRTPKEFVRRCKTCGCRRRGWRGCRNIPGEQTKIFKSAFPRVGEAQPNCVRVTLECGALWVGEADFSSAFQSHVIFVYAHLRIRMMRDLKAEMNLRTPKMLRIGEAQPGFAACAVSKLFARRLADRSDFRNSRSHPGVTE